MEEVVRVSVYCSFVSLICGLASLLLPLLALWKRKHTAALAAISMGLCAVSLLGQIFDYNVHVYAGDMSTLLDISAGDPLLRYSAGRIGCGSESRRSLI